MVAGAPAIVPLRPRAVPEQPSPEDIEQALRTSLESQGLAPYDLTEDEEKKLVNWACDEVNRAIANRQGFERDVREWVRNYEQEPLVKIRTWPWYRASNLVVPLTSTSVDAIYAQIQATLFGTEEFWHLGPATSEIWREPARQLSEFMNWARTNDFDLYGAVSDASLECLKLGTSILTAGYQYYTQKTRTLTPQRLSVIEEKVVKDGVHLEAVPLLHFIVPGNARGIQRDKSKWVCRVITELTWGDLIEWEHRGWLNPGFPDEIKSWYADQPDVKTRCERRKIGIEEYLQEETYDIHELWGAYDIDGDKREEEIKLRFHLKSRKHGFSMPNDNIRNVRPFFRLRFFPREHSFYGIGIAEMLDQLQEEISTIHNQRIDNATIANMPGIKRKHASLTGRTEKEHIYPGKTWWVDDMADIDTFMLGERYRSTEVDESMAMMYGQRRVGATDYSLGLESPTVGSRATATSTTALLHQSNKRFELTLRDNRMTLSELGMFIISQYQLNNPRGIRWAKYDPEKKAKVDLILSLPPEDVYDNLTIDLAATSATLNRELEKQNTAGLFSVLMQYYKEMFQAVPMLVQLLQVSPGLAELMLKAGDGAAGIMRRIVSLSDIKDAPEFVPALRDALQGGLLGGGGAAGGSPRPVGPTGQPAIPRTDQDMR